MKNTEPVPTTEFTETVLYIVEPNAAVGAAVKHTREVLVAHDAVEHVPVPMVAVGVVSRTSKLRPPTVTERVAVDAWL